MKRIFLILLVGVAVLGVAKAYIYPLAKLTVQVVDENGGAVGDALVKMTFQNPVPAPKNWGTGRDNKIVTASTDPAGTCSMSGHCNGELGGGVTKEGYYRGWWNTFTFANATDGKWQPWNPIVRVVLKKILNPIPMYARKAQIEIPTGDQAAGFDLMRGDWVAPNGQGSVADLNFKLKRRFENRRDYESAVTITFSNPGDGLRAVDVPSESGSALKLPRTAFQDGYAPELTTGIAASPGRPGREDARANRSYLFRVRTQLDQNKQPVDGLYGKIDGDIRLDAINSKTCIVLLTYYLNPKPNDQNLEFDPKRNLFTDLKPEERVTEP